jgi:hypothetical protein
LLVQLIYLVPLLFFPKTLLLKCHNLFLNIFKFDFIMFYYIVYLWQSVCFKELYLMINVSLYFY